MAETPEFSTTVTVRLRGKAYSEEVMQNRWNSIMRQLWREFGPGNVEVIIEPCWEVEMVPDTTEQPEL